MADKTTDICTACKGSGYLREYAHIDRGVCYQCSGKGEVSVRKAKAAEKEREEDKRFMLEVIRGHLASIKETSTARSAFSVQEVTNSTYQVAGAYIKLMAYGHDFSERVRGRIAANLTPEQYKKFEDAVADELKKRKRRQ